MKRKKTKHIDQDSSVRHRQSHSVRDRLPVVLFLLCFSLYFLTSSGIPISGDEINQYYTGVAIFENGNIYIPKNIAQLYTYDGKGYTIKALPGNSILFIPFHILDKIFPIRLNYRAIYYWSGFKNVVFGSLVVLFVFLLCMRFYDGDKKLSFWLAIYAGLCTYFWYYTKTWRYQLTITFFYLLSFYLIYQYKTSGKKKNLFWAGVLVGFSIITMHLSAIFGGLLALYYGYIEFKVKGKKITNVIKDIVIYFGIPVAFSLIIIGYWNFLRWGNALYIEPPMSYFNRPEEPWKIPDPMPNIMLMPGHIYYYFLSPTKSMVVLVPPFLLTLLGIKRFWKKMPPEMLFFSLFILSTMIFYASFRDYVWGDVGSAGFRYFVSLIPFMVIPSGFFIQRFKESDLYNKYKKIWRWGFIGYTAILIILNFTLASMNYREYRMCQAIVQKYPDYDPMHYWDIRTSEYFIFYNRFLSVLERKTGIALPRFPLVKDDVFNECPSYDFSFWWARPYYNTFMSFLFWVSLILMLYSVRYLYKFFKKFKSA
ncbi:MAG: hypothetical protein JW827_00320 [Spirochaetes bacterium]|nr:hypothetical protein [Spirochaetota bacterium]